MLTQVKSFKTSDGRLFTDKVQALGNEFTIELRGIINQGNHAKNDNLSTIQAAGIIANEGSKIKDAINRYQAAIKRAMPKVKPE